MFNPQLTSDSSQEYQVYPRQIGTLVNWLDTGELAVPEIQRPFVWDSTQVRELIHSLYRGYPIGYTIIWKNSSAPLKDGTPSATKYILIDGQQRLVALRTAVLGQHVRNSKYELERIQIAFNPHSERFEVARDRDEPRLAWVEDISKVFRNAADIVSMSKDYVERNAKANLDRVTENLFRLFNIGNHQVGVIELTETLTLDRVAEIFRLVNRQGVRLSEADFVMSKLAADQRHGGNQIRKGIDYFCHLFQEPDIYEVLSTSDEVFTTSPYYRKMAWLANKQDHPVFVPNYTDVIRVAFTSRQRRGKLQDLVALLSGRNFDTRTYEIGIAEDTFQRLSAGLLDAVSESRFQGFMAILQSAGFIQSDMLSNRSAISFAYVLYLRGKALRIPGGRLDSLIRRWLVMSVLTNRYSGSIETRIESDVRQLPDESFVDHCDRVMANEVLTDSYWKTTLPFALAGAKSNSRYKQLIVAAQVTLNIDSFLSKHNSVATLLGTKFEWHHIYPRNHLIKSGISTDIDNLANLVVTHPDINKAIADASPADYFAALQYQCNEPVEKLLGDIVECKAMKRNLKMNCIPPSMLKSTPTYSDFLRERSVLLARCLKKYFDQL